MEKYENSYNVLKNSYERFYNTNINENEKSFELLEGRERKNVMFSCPHAVSQTRKGKNKLADINTGPLGMALHSLGYTVLIKTKNCNDDANYDKKSEYKEFLKNYIKKNNIKYLIDLHGMSKKRSVLISLGTLFGHNSNASLELTNQFIKIANKNNINVDAIRIDFPFSASKTTVSSYIKRKNKIETLQIEINSQFFDDKMMTINIIKTLDDYAKLLEKVVAFSRISLKPKDVYDAEKLFQKRLADEVFKFNCYNSEILLTAPHSCSMIKENKECYKETSSEAVVSVLSEKLKLDSCYKTKKTEYDSTEEYIKNIENYVKGKPTKIIIEFHIMNPSRIEDVTILTNQGFSINNNLEIISTFIKTLLSHKFINISLDYPFNALNLNSSVAQLYKQTKIPSLQLIINQRVIQNKKKLQNLLNALETIIAKLNYIL